MESKEQLNQNPEIIKEQNQEENSKSDMTPKSEEKATKTESVDPEETNLRGESVMAEKVNVSPGKTEIDKGEKTEKEQDKPSDEPDVKVAEKKEKAAKIESVDPEDTNLLEKPLITEKVNISPGKSEKDKDEKTEKEQDKPSDEPDVKVAEKKEKTTKTESVDPEETNLLEKPLINEKVNISPGKSENDKDEKIEKEQDKPSDEPDVKVAEKKEKTTKTESVDPEKTNLQGEPVMAEKMNISQEKSEKDKDEKIEKEQDKPSDEPDVKVAEKKETDGQIAEKDSDASPSDDKSIIKPENEHQEKEEENESYTELSREELVVLIEELVKQENIDSIRKKVALIKVAFLKINKEDQHQKYESFITEGGEKNDFDSSEDSIEIRFNEAFSIYKSKRQVFLEEQEKLKQDNLESKKIILEELKSLIDSEESLKKTYDQFKVLQEKWKEIGMVPKKEVNNLWQNYHFLVEKFFDKVKINKELRDLDLKKNLESKIELCEKAEELLLETSILKSFKQLQLYHQKWKETGPVPIEKKEEIWERFKNTTDKINQLRKEHYNKLQEEQKNNLIAKTALCEKAEEILLLENKSVKDWQNRTDQINELLKIWKTIGQAPRKENDEIWDRFKSSLDTFFSGKKEYFQKIKEEQLNNYNIKLDLCLQAEAIMNNTEWKKTTHELINLQKEWKEIGPVPRKHSDKIWKRFRAASDKFFNLKSDYYSNIGKHEADNLKLKEDLINKVETYKFGDDKNANLEVLKGFQREWTDIGHVPIKEKDRTQSEFRDSINKQLDKLKINKAEIQTLNFKQRFEGIKENPNAKKILSNEKNFLIGKKKKLEDEINLWENNLGFLASSKKADLLIQEFEKKINMAKAEIEILNEKIKFLKSESRF